MRLRDIMTKEVESIDPETSATEALTTMRKNGIRHLVVMKRGVVVGILSERDLGGPHGLSVREGKTVEELMSTSVATAMPDTPLEEAANLMRGATIGCLPVVDRDRLVGIVTVSDLIELIARQKLAVTA